MNLIGRLERLPLRQVWGHEAYDFTRWLQDNIDVLNATIDLNLVNVERERAAGPFSVDLVAEDEGGGKVIIENQLEKSNHDHLGKLLTYFTAFEARAAVWIVAEPRPEHVAVIAWLNDSSSGRFYLVKVEAIRIGDSAPAPLLTLILGPSEEAQEVAQSKREFNGRYELRHRWWSALVKRPDAKLHAHITPGSYSWIGTSSGVRGLNLNYVVTKDECGAELYIDRGEGSAGDNVAIFGQLLEHQAQIEIAISHPVEWQRLDGKRACRIKIIFEGGYKSLELEWPEIQARVVSAMNQLDAALKPYLRSLRLTA